MATASVTTQPEVYVPGGGREERYAYLCGSVDTIGKGDLIRINDAGTIDLAESASAGAVHGIALEDGTAGAALPVFLFASDTQVKIQCVDTVAPEDLTAGEAYTLEDGTNVWGVTSTTTNGVAIVVDEAATDQPWTIARGGWGETASTNNNSVIVRFAAATLDATAAAAS